ncbi:MAG: hypothetical protein DRP35_10315 [Candidatus Zixiibacteriota bacterium]|nr:MAG: hypothetical protein DRP35_10315 [candidate division Zixibacteria bacterium]
MRILFLFSLLCLTISIVNAQNLVVGFTDPNEVMSLTSGTYNYDTLYILNNGELNLSNQVNFTVNDMVAVVGTGRLNVNHSVFTANQLFYMQDSAIANFSDTVNLPCSFFLAGQSLVQMDSAVVNIPMTYKGQYSWAAGGHAGFFLNRSQYYLGAGALGGNFVDSSFFHQYNTDYFSTLLPMTMGVAGNSSLVVDSCSGGMEFVISQGANINIHASDFFVIWFTFADGDTANYSYPPANSTVPNASNVTGDYYFADSLSGVSGVDFSVHIANADAVFWGIISKKNSSVVVNNSILIACGFYFDGTSVNTANGFFDSQNYTTYQAPFSDRQFQVNNTTVEAWNFYPTDSSEIVIDSCIYGESLGFGNGITKVINSTCDGTGGYFGGTNDSRTFVYNSQIIRTGGSAQIINFQNDAKAWLYRSVISGASVVNNNSEMFYANCQYDSIPVVNDNGYFAEAWLDSLNGGFVDSAINITGRIFDINGPLNLSEITRYTIQYSLPDTSNMIPIKDTSAASFNLINQSLANWNTQGVSVGNYLVWLTLFVDGNSAISCNRNIYLDHYTGLPKNDLANRILIYPNPAHDYIGVTDDNLLIVNGKIDILDITGKIVKQSKFLNSESIIKIEDLEPGIYFVKIFTRKGDLFVKKLIIE